MTAIIDNFVALRKSTGDVLKPTEYETICAMIQTMIIDYTAFNTAVTDMQSHVVNYNDPHDDAASLYSDVIQHIYNIYVEMSPSPLTLSQFTTTIVPSVQFIELVRRIMLNRYLFDQLVVSPNTVKAYSNALLTPDWGYFNIPQAYTSEHFDTDVIGETAFIAQGVVNDYKSNINVFNSNFLNSDIDDRTVIFYTSSSNPRFVASGPSVGYNQNISPVTNDISIYLRTVFLPTTTTTIFQLTSAAATFTLTMTNTGMLNAYVNGTILNSVPIAYGDGRIFISIGKSQTLQINTSNGSFHANYSALVYQFLTGRITSFTTTVPLEDLSIAESSYLTSSSGSTMYTDDSNYIVTSSNSNFAVRELCIYEGFTDLFPQTAYLETIASTNLPSNVNNKEIIETDGGLPILV